MNVVIKVNDEIKKKMIEYYKDKVRDKKIPYVVFQAQEEDTVITMYESGKVMFQGVSADVDAAMWGVALENTKEEKEKSIEEFEFKLNKMSVSGALFDMVKLLDVSKIVISKYSAEEVYKNGLECANKFDEELAKMLQENKEYTFKVLQIERGNEKPRKDIAKWAEIKNAIYYMYDEKFFNLDNNFEYAKINDKEEIKKILSLYLEKYFNINDDKQTWFDKIKDLSEELGYAREVKMFKQEPEKWKAHVGDVSTVLRVSLTGRQQTPDLYEIMQVLGKESVEKRFKKIIEK